MHVRAGLTALAILFAATGTNAADPEMDYLRQIDSYLDQNDFAGAKNVLVDMQKLGFHSGLAPRMESLDACIQAHGTKVTATERKAMEGDMRSGETFSPDDDFKAATAFANGWGVPKDRKRAIALICPSKEIARAEWENSLSFLLDSAYAEEDFSYCSNVTSGWGMGACAAFDEHAVQQERDRRLAELTRKFSPAQKNAYAALTKAAENYIDAHSRDEQDMSGTMRGAFYTAESGSMHENFLKAVESFEYGKRPPKDDFAAADKALNAAYRKLLTTTDWSIVGDVTALGVRKTERLWLKYRDAWAAFGTARYPGTTADQWKTWATQARIATIKRGFGPYE